mmetsp:Transcript_20111/g.57646  ORF Transcript_20111/g.57646 Transcript_20111/m.57646 type:complete len:624 (+) Transcript_20111:184-2055(+)
MQAPARHPGAPCASHHGRRLGRRGPHRLVAVELCGVVLSHPLHTRIRQHRPSAKRDRALALDARRLLGRVLLCGHVGLDHLQPLGRLARRPVRHHLRRQLARQHRALHRAKELLRGPVAGEGEARDGRLLRRAVLVAAGDGSVDRARHFDDGELPQPRLSLGSLLRGRGPALIVCDLRREKARELAHGGVDDLLVALPDPVRIAARELGAGREHELEHRALVVGVLLAGGGHVRIDGEERRAREAEVVDALQLPVKPHVEVDDRNALQLIGLPEEGHRRPLRRQHPLEHVHGQRRDVLVRGDHRAVAHLQPRHRAVLRGHDLLEGRVQPHLAATCLDVPLEGLAQPLGLPTVNEGHLQPVVLVEETVHRGEHHRHRELVGVDEVERLCHRNEDLLVDPLRHSVLAHEVEHGELVLRVDEILPLDQHRQQRWRRLHLLAQREHLLVEQDGQPEVEWRRDPGQKVKRGELARQLLHRKDHLVDLPLEPVVDAKLGEKAHHVWVRAEKDVQPRLNCVAILVRPRRNLAAEHVARLEDDRCVARIGEIFGTGEAGEAAADDGDRLLLPLPGIRRDFLRERLTLQIVVGLEDALGRRVILHQGRGAAQRHAHLRRHGRWQRVASDGQD